MMSEHEWYKDLDVPTKFRCAKCETVQKWVPPKDGLPGPPCYPNDTGRE